MKKHSTNLFDILSKEELQNLLVIISETLALDFEYRKRKKFAAVDLWNIRCQGARRKNASYFQKLDY